LGSVGAIAHLHTPRLIFIRQHLTVPGNLISFPKRRVSINGKPIWIKATDIEVAKPNIPAGDIETGLIFMVLD
jgi:hypothetical protein